MKIIFAIILIIHGLIHIMGFTKAYACTKTAQLTKDISKPMGIIWLIVALLFVVAAILLLFKNDGWLIPGVVAIIISQILIFSVWQDAKFGTIANIVILVVAILSLGSIRFETSYKNYVKENVLHTSILKTDILTEADLLPLPEPVQRYLKYAGVLNKPKVKNVKAVFEGQMREQGKDYFSFTSEQFNFFDEPTRLFFMKGKIFGVNFLGYHKYSNVKAMMDIRLLGLFPIVKKEGKDMDQAETVTLFNDMCLMAPATLIDKRIIWQAIDSNSAKATFTNLSITISAILYFNEKGQLIDFISNDRDVNHYPFSTPVSNYKNVNGINIMTYGETIWHYPDGKFVYGKFHLKEIEYNVSAIK